jgi:hypothetical protein
MARSLPLPLWCPEVRLGSNIVHLVFSYKHRFLCTRNRDFKDIGWFVCSFILICMLLHFNLYAFNVWKFIVDSQNCFFIHPTTNFYATLASKTFLCSLTQDCMRPISHHVPWFKFQILNFFQKYIHNGSWIVHKNVRGSTMKTVFQSDALLRDYRKKIEEIGLDACIRQRVSAAVRWVSSSQRDLYAVTNGP